MLSLLAVGGAITTAPDMQRYLVREQGWLSDAQFSASVALAQAAPGPNVLFVAVLGFNVGGLAGVLATMCGTLLPSTVLALGGHALVGAQRRVTPASAFTTGMAPLTIGLLVASAWVLLEPVGLYPPALLLVAATVVVHAAHALQPDVAHRRRRGGRRAGMGMRLSAAKQTGGGAWPPHCCGAAAVGAGPLRAPSWRCCGGARRLCSSTPRCWRRTTASTLPADAHEVWVDVPGARLHALHLRLPQPRGVVFFLHGNAGSLQTWFVNTGYYRRLNLDLFMLDYRGFGKSSGHIDSEAQLMADVRAAWAQIAPLYAGRQRVFYGRSLGTGLAAQLAAEVQPDLTVLVSPYTSMEALAAEKYPWVPAPLLRYPLRTDLALPRVQGRVLLMHGGRDTLIPPTHSERLQAVQPRAELLWVPEAGHGDIHKFRCLPGRAGRGAGALKGAAAPQAARAPGTQRRWRSASYRHTPAATLTFRLSTAPAMGMRTSSSQCRRVSWRMPLPSAPSTSATGPLRSTS